MALVDLSRLVIARTRLTAIETEIRRLSQRTTGAAVISSCSASAENVNLVPTAEAAPPTPSRSVVFGGSNGLPEVTAGDLTRVSVLVVRREPGSKGRRPRRARPGCVLAPVQPDARLPGVPAAGGHGRARRATAPGRRARDSRCDLQLVVQGARPRSPAAGRCAARAAGFVRARH